MSRAGFAYAQARMQARMERRFSEDDWRMLASSRNFGSCLDMVNQSAAANITARMDRTYSVHAVERVLREEWSAIVMEIAGWLPNQWRDATIWMTVLPHLRRFEYAPEKDSSLRWLQLENEFPEAVDVIRADDKAASSMRQVAGIWHQEWCSRLPNKRHGNGIDMALSPLLDRYLGQGAPRANEAPITGGNLVGILKGHFRKQSQTPVAIFAFLGLIALDFERLRGVFADRIIFSQPSETEVT